MTKNMKKYHFLHFFAIKDPLKKLKATKSKFYLHNSLGNIIVHIHAIYRKDRMKTEGAYSIWKKVDRRSDRRTKDDSASDKLRWLYQQRR